MATISRSMNARTDMTNACLRLMPTAIVLVASLVMPPAALARQAPAANAHVGEAANPSAPGVFKIAPAWLDATPPLPGAQAPEPACADCPRRRPGFAAIETVGVNVLFNLMNRALRPAEERDQFKVGFSSWWNNLKYGFEWDDNSFQVNQIGHPYQGGLYFNAARSNGLSFWESAPYAAFGSAMWEFFGETHKPAMNDFINTTVGGIAIGEEMLHRAWLDNPRPRPNPGGAGRNNELLATIIDPITGANRFLTGDASRRGSSQAREDHRQWHDGGRHGGRGAVEGRRHQGRQRHGQSVPPTRLRLRQHAGHRAADKGRTTPSRWRSGSEADTPSRRRPSGAGSTGGPWGSRERGDRREFTVLQGYEIKHQRRLRIRRTVG